MARNTESGSGWSPDVEQQHIDDFNKYFGIPQYAEDYDVRRAKELRDTQRYAVERQRQAYRDAQKAIEAERERLAAERAAAETALAEAQQEADPFDIYAQRYGGVSDEQYAHDAADVTPVTQLRRPVVSAFVPHRPIIYDEPRRISRRLALGAGGAGLAGLAATLYGVNPANIFGQRRSNGVQAQTAGLSGEMRQHRAKERKETEPHIQYVPRGNPLRVPAGKYLELTNTAHRINGVPYKAFDWSVGDTPSASGYNKEVTKGIEAASVMTGYIAEIYTADEIEFGNFLRLHAYDPNTRTHYDTVYTHMAEFSPKVLEALASLKNARLPDGSIDAGRVRVELAYGETFGKVGRTGAPGFVGDEHLHMEVRKNGNNVDPLMPPFMSTVPFFAEVPEGMTSILTSHIKNPDALAAQIDDYLERYGSPAVGMGRTFVEQGIWHGIDPRFVIAKFMHESTLGTNTDWAGFKGDANKNGKVDPEETTGNVGNIIWFPGSKYTARGRFKDYNGSFPEGIADANRLLYEEYIAPNIPDVTPYGRGIHTVEDIIPVWAPSSDNNDVPRYISAVRTVMNQFA